MRTFFVDSRSCVGTASDFLYGLTRSLNVQEGRFRVDNLRVPLTFNLVNRNNQNLYWLDNGTYRTAQIARGNYTSETLPAAIQAAFTAGGGSPVTVAYDQTPAQRLLPSPPPPHGRSSRTRSCCCSPAVTPWRT
jgi:hypothetical protein